MNTQNKNRTSFNDALNILSTNGFTAVYFKMGHSIFNLI